MMFGKGKINTVRTLAMGLVFGGMIVMYGSFLVDASWAMAIFFILGLLMVLASSVVYFLIGILSTKAVYVDCPSCGKSTKMLGRLDQCMHCKQELTLDPDLATDNRKSKETH